MNDFSENGASLISLRYFLITMFKKVTISRTLVMSQYFSYSNTINLFKYFFQVFFSGAKSMLFISTVMKCNKFLYKLQYVIIMYYDYRPAQLIVQYKSFFSCNFFSYPTRIINVHPIFRHPLYMCSTICDLLKFVLFILLCYT